jgi:small-conductance mechanosensitive channel
MLPEALQSNTPHDWLMAIGVAAGSVTALVVLRSLLLHRLGQLAGRTATALDDLLIDMLRATRILLVGSVSVYAASHFLNLPQTWQAVVDRGFVCLMILQCGLWLNRGVIFWLQQRFAGTDAADAGSQAMTRSLLSFLARMLLWSLVLLLLLDNLGLNVTALIASLGVGGIAVALAVQNILGDLFASLSIAIDKPFVIGDFVVIDDLAGTVEHVGLKTTRIRSLGGEQIVFSNNDLLKSRIRNYKRMQERRVVFSLGVTYDTSAEQLQDLPALIEQAVIGQPMTRFERAHFKSFGAYSLDFEVVYQVLTADYKLYMDAQQAINLQLVRAFAAAGIEFAYPTQTLQLLRATPAQQR